MKNTTNGMIGDQITWKAAGKVARLEGKAGQLVTGTITGRADDGGYYVLADHRTVAGAAFHGMESLVHKPIRIISGGAK